MVFLIFTTQLYQYFNVFCLFALFSDEPEVFLPKYYSLPEGSKRKQSHVYLNFKR